MARQLSLFDFLPSQQPNSQPAKDRDKNADKKTARPIIRKAGKNKSLKDVFAEVLNDYLPSGSVERVSAILAQHKVFVKIKHSRHSKLGDYRSPRINRDGSVQQGTGHRITINHDLNKYAFLITMVHEIAHLSAWELYRRKALPHGKEWKQQFRKIMYPFIEQGIFPENVASALKNYLQNPAALNCTDTALLKILRKYNNKSSENVFHLEDLAEGAVFQLKGTKKNFVKGKKLRKRFLCSQLNSKRKYLVSPVAEVVVEKEKNYG